MFKQKGFTLVELIIVIVILAIMSSVAVATFAPLSRDARIASLMGIKGALSSTSQLIEVKATLEGINYGNVEVNDQAVAVVNGYISGSWNNAWRYALDIGIDTGATERDATCTGNAICALGGQSEIDGLPDSVELNGQFGLTLLWLKDDTLSDKCFAYYYNPGMDNSGDTSNEKPTVGTVDEGC